MTDTININTARRQANSYAKAKTMTAAGYRLERIGGFKDLFSVYSPEGNEYGVDLQFIRCTCADFVKHQNFCKHTLWAGLELERQEDEKMWESICAEHDKRMEEEGEEEYTPPTSTLCFLEAIQARLVADLNKARERYERPSWKSHTDYGMEANRLENALHVIGDMWGKEMCGRLNLMPADEVKI